MRPRPTAGVPVTVSLGRDVTGTANPGTALAGFARQLVLGCVIIAALRLQTAWQRPSSSPLHPADPVHPVYSRSPGNQPSHGCAAVSGRIWQARKRCVVQRAEPGGSH